MRQSPLHGLLEIFGHFLLLLVQLLSLLLRELGVEVLALLLQGLLENRLALLLSLCHLSSKGGLHLGLDLRSGVLNCPLQPCLEFGGLVVHLPLKGLLLSVQGLGSLLCQLGG